MCNFLEIIRLNLSRLCERRLRLCVGMGTECEQVPLSLFWSVWIVWLESMSSICLLM